ncbi:MAG: TIGR04139 family peptide modification target [Sphingobacterium sp.]|jgi:putative peptide modification target (TIGR04139 family)|nr:TIGR04139 family peptide modification target [Sphingobacterium sp.]
MKKLSGMKSFSSLENKKLNVENLRNVTGGSEYSEVSSNFLNASGARDYDIYSRGRYIGRQWDNSDCISNSW